MTAATAATAAAGVDGLVNDKWLVVYGDILWLLGLVLYEVVPCWHSC